MTLADPGLHAHDNVTGGSAFDADLLAEVSFQAWGDEGERGLPPTRRFKRLIEAILFVVEEVPREQGQRALIHACGRVHGWAQIKREYERRLDGF